MTRIAPLLGLLLLAAPGCWRRAVPPLPAPAVAVKTAAAPIPGPAAAQPLAFTFANGLDKDDRAAFYHLAEGSEVFPLDWLRVIESKDTGKPFLENMERFGFIPDPDDPDGLPVGITADTARGLEPLGRMVGINCAACHVGELTYQGKSLRIDGAPNLVNTRTFFADLVESALGTVEDPHKLVTFLSRLREEREDHQAAAPSRIREGARKLLKHAVDRADPDLKDALAGLAKKIIERARAHKEFDLKATVKEPNPDPAGLRKRLLDGFNLDAARALVGESRVLNRLAAVLDAEADREGSLLHALEEAYINVRLLRSRAEFLKRLGYVGQDRDTDWGPGRVDAFGSARAFLFQEGYSPRYAVSYPHLWMIGRTPFFHYDGNTTSVLERNFGQALGVGAVYDPDSFASTLRADNLHRLEKLAWKIEPPKWPEELLGKIDRVAVKRGEALFAEHCKACHQILQAGERARDQLTALDEVKTDRARAESFAEKLPGGQPLYEAIRDTMAKIKEKALDDLNLTPEQRKEIGGDGKAEWRAMTKYAGRPLDGIWATAPYLHNGSVPTLHDLLRPAKDRPTRFHVGSREYDPVKLGYVATGDGLTPNFDATTPGNTNVGHEYGTTLPDADRTALLEYLKAH